MSGIPSCPSCAIMAGIYSWRVIGRGGQLRRFSSEHASLSPRTPRANCIKADTDVKCCSVRFILAFRVELMTGIGFRTRITGLMYESYNLGLAVDRVVKNDFESMVFEFWILGY
mgnify:CR=1 FL=1